MSEDVMLEDDPASIEVYQRGVSLIDVAVGAFGRFLPASLITLGLTTALTGVGVPGLGLAAVLSLIAMAVTMSLGFGLGVAALSRWLYPDAEVDGRRSAVAGFVSPLAWFISLVFSGGLTIGQLPILLGVAGFVLALLIYFPWLTETPEEIRNRSRFKADSVPRLTEPDTLG